MLVTLRKRLYLALIPNTSSGVFLGNMMTTFQQLEAAEYEAAYNPADRFAGFDCGDRDYDYEAAQQDQNEEFARENGL